MWLISCSAFHCFACYCRASNCIAHMSNSSAMQFFRLTLHISKILSYVPENFVHCNAPQKHQNARTISHTTKLCILWWCIDTGESEDRDWHCKGGERGCVGYLQVKLLVAKSILLQKTFVLKFTFSDTSAHGIHLWTLPGAHSSPTKTLTSTTSGTLIYSLFNFSHSQ